MARSPAATHATHSAGPRGAPARFLYLLSAASVVPAFLDAAQTYVKEVMDDRPGIGWNAVLFQGAEWLFLGALLPITYGMAARFPLRRGALARTLLPHLAGALLLCVGWATLGIVAGRWLDAWMAQGELSTAYVNWLLTSLPWSVIMYFLVLGCVHAFTYFAEARAREAQASRLAAQLAEARLDALRMQLNPHFLFNSLNAATVLVREQSTQAATRVLELLGDMLRHVLRSDLPREIPLREELAFLRQYLTMEEIRFPDRLRVTWQIDPGTEDALVPPFILQPLVENAIRHGIARRAGAGEVGISAQARGDRLALEVSDDGGTFDEPDRTRDGVGLSNTRERLATLYGAAASLEIGRGAEGATVASIVVPLRYGATVEESR